MSRAAARRNIQLELQQLQDRARDEPFSNTWQHYGRTGYELPFYSGWWIPRADIYVDSPMKGNVRVEIEVPGIPAENIGLKVEDEALIISSNKPLSKKEEKGKYYQNERHFGNFYRKLELPFKVSPHLVRATLDCGVLKVIIPQSDTASSERIAVQPGPIHGILPYGAQQKLHPSTPPATQPPPYPTTAQQAAPPPPTTTQPVPQPPSYQPTPHPPTALHPAPPPTTGYIAPEAAAPQRQLITVPQPEVLPAKPDQQPRAAIAEETAATPPQPVARPFSILDSIPSSQPHPPPPAEPKATTPRYGYYTHVPIQSDTAAGEHRMHAHVHTSATESCNSHYHP